MPLYQFHYITVRKRTPRNKRPDFFEMTLEDNQRLVSAEWESDHVSVYSDRKTIDWTGTLLIETRC